MTITQILKWERKLINGRGDKYYPKDLVEHVKMAVLECDNCKNILAENLAIKLNIIQNGGQYRKEGKQQ